MVDLIHACIEGTPLEQSKASLGVEVTPEVVEAVNVRLVRAYLAERDGDRVYGRRTKKHSIELLPAEATTAASPAREPEETPPATGQGSPARAEAGAKVKEPPEPSPVGGEEGWTPPRSGQPEGSMDDLREKARRLGIDFADLLRAGQSIETAAGK